MPEYQLYFSSNFLFFSRTVSAAFTLASSHTEMYIPLGIGVVGAAIGLFRRATRVGGSKRKG